VRALSSSTYHIDSFFDIWLELSLDGGQTWAPATSSMAIELTDPTQTVEVDVIHEIAGELQLEVWPSLSVFSPSAALPPLEGMYATAEQTFVAFHGTDLELIIQDARLRPFADPPPVITVVGADEQESYQSSLRAVAIVTSTSMGFDHVQIPIEFLGPVTTRASGRAVQNTGIFVTEMLAMNLSGQIGGQTVLIRESPTRVSEGSTSIAQLPGGNYQIDSFFDIWTEI
jgi:hypothetical protein